MTVVVALQDAIPAGGPGRLASAHGVRRWAYVGDDTVWRLRAERGGPARVSLADALQDAASRLRAPYLDWIGELSQANASSEWWASELAAKNALDPLYGRICSLAAAGELLASGELDDALLVCSTPALANGVFEAARSAGRDATRIEGGEGSMRRPQRAPALRRLVEAWATHAPRLLRDLPARRSDAALALADSPAYRRRVLEEVGLGPPSAFAGPGSMLLFTWVDLRSVGTDGRYRDPHFGELPALLEGAGAHVAFVAHPLPGAFTPDLVAALRDSGGRLIHPDTLLDRDDWEQSRERAERFAPVVPPDAAVEGVPARALALEHIEEARDFHPKVLVYERLIERLVEHRVRPERVVLPYEGHGWEQVVTQAFNRLLPETKVIGYDNVNFSRLALSMYPAASELGLRPLPESVVTNGETFRDVLVEEGFPPDRVAVGCALRHAYIGGDASEGRPVDGQVRVLAATSISLGHSVELVDKAVAAFGGDERYELTIKCHPFIGTQAVSRLLAAALPANARFSETPISDLLDESDMLLYGYSVVCYEALAKGIPAVLVRAESGLDLDQLEPFPQLRRAARSPAELRTAAESIAARDADERARFAAAAREAVAQALAPIDEACARPFL